MSQLTYTPGTVQQFTSISDSPRKERKLSYSCLIQMRENALWAAEMTNANANMAKQNGLTDSANSLCELAVRYYKILNYIEDRMRISTFIKLI